MRDTTKAVVLYSVFQGIALAAIFLFLHFDQYGWAVIAGIVSALLRSSGVDDYPPFNDGRKVICGPFWTIKSISQH